MFSSTLTLSERRRMRSALRIAGMDAGLADQAIPTGGQTWRLTTEPSMACKIYRGRGAESRFRFEATALPVLHAKGAPVPQLHAAMPSVRALVRAWVPGVPLTHYWGSHNVVYALASAVEAWGRMQSVLADWGDALSSDRVTIATETRRAELRWLTGRICDRLRARGIDLDAEIDDLAVTLAADQVCFGPLDASPSNIIVEAPSATFIDIESVGFDYPGLALCKQLLPPLDASVSAPAVVQMSRLAELIRPTGMAEHALEALDAASVLLMVGSVVGAWNDIGSVDPWILFEALGDERAATGRTAAIRARLDHMGRAKAGGVH